MVFLTLLLATASPAQQAAAPQPTTEQRAYDMAVTCASAHMVASVVVGQMGDTQKQADMRKLAEGFEVVGVTFGERLGLDRTTVRTAMAAEAAARVAPLEQPDAPPSAEFMAAWAEELNQQIDACHEFAVSLSGAAAATE